MIFREDVRMEEHRRWMALALEEARKAARQGEVPVGAVIVRGGELLVRAGNTRETRGNALGHAELTAISEACRLTGDWRLTGCTLYVTLEPCCMCAGACLNARLERVVYGAEDEAAGCLGSRINLFGLELAGGEAPGILGGVLAEECREVLQVFFQERRAGKPPQADPSGPAAAGIPYPATAEPPP